MLLIAKKDMNRQNESIAFLMLGSVERDDCWTDSGRSRSRLAKREIVDSPVIAWHGPSSLDANDLVRGGWRQGAKAAPSPFEQKKVEEWLSERLAAGPKLAKEIDAQAKLDEVPSVLLRRAKISLGIIPTGTNGHSMWKLPSLIEGDLRSAACRGQETVTQQQLETATQQGAEKIPSPLAGEGGELASRVRGEEQAMRDVGTKCDEEAESSASPSPPTPLPQGERGVKKRAGSVSDRSSNQESVSESIDGESESEADLEGPPVAHAPGSPGKHRRAANDKGTARRADAAPLALEAEPIPPEMLRREEELIAKAKALLQRMKASESRFLATRPPPKRSC